MTDPITTLLAVLCWSPAWITMNSENAVIMRAISIIFHRPGVSIPPFMVYINFRHDL